MRKNGFTMIELVFVIVVLGILAAIAIPRLAATRTDAVIAKGRSDVASIRSAIISERQRRLIKGETNFATSLDGGGKLFGAVLTYGIPSSTKEGHWSGTNPTYYFHVQGNNIKFTYDKDKGTFDCDHTNTYCKKLTE